MDRDDPKDGARFLNDRRRPAGTRRDDLVDSTLRDLRTAFRAIRNGPGFAVTVIVTLALGISASATIFSVVDHVLLRPLAYADADRLVTLSQRGTGGNTRLVSYPTLQDWAGAGAGFTAMAWIRGDGLTLELPDGPQRAVVGFVSPGFFRLMGQAAALGRTFAPDEEAPGGTDVVVLSNDLWQKTFGGDRRIVGRVVRLDSANAVVVGVMPPGFAYPTWAGLWRPVARAVDRDPVIRHRDFHADSRAIGRLATGVDVVRATRLLSVVQQRIARAYPDAEKDWTGAQVVPLRDEIVGDVRGALWGLGAAVVLILLVACANVANLAAVRGASRGREVAIRLALGARRAQVIRHLMAEMVTLATVGGALGIVAAWRAVAWLRATAPFDLPRADELALDARAVAVAAALTIITAVLFGVVPALRAATGSGSPGSLLGSRSSAGGQHESRGRAMLTIVQFALALMLLVGAGLLGQSYRRLLAAHLGFDPHGVLALAASPPRTRYGTPESALALYQRIIDRLRAEPGVGEAAVVNFLPSGRAGVPTRIEIPGRPVSSDDQATYVTASEAYMRALRLSLIRGRWFTPAEERAAGDGIVISEAVAKRYWPGQNPVGRPLTIFRSSQVRADFGQAVPAVVIGVVGDVRQYGPETDPDPAVYVPISAEPWAWVSFIVRPREGASVSVEALRRAVAEVEPRLLAMGAGTALTFTKVESSLSASLAPRRYVLSLVGAFSACALLLAAVGVYGVASYSVTRRTREFGIRIALGATMRQVTRSVLAWGLTLAVAGCAIGLAATLLLVRLIQHLLFGTAPTDPTVLATVPVVLIAIGVTAVYLPARRAARADPIVALRSE